MIGFLFCLVTRIASASEVPITQTPFPVFLKAGFSSVLEFDESPTKVVLGDSASFQIEKLDHSLVIRTLVSYATTNMFVYFQNQTPRLFVVTASEDSEPTYYKKFEKPPKLSAPSNNPKVLVSAPSVTKRSSRVLASRFDAKKTI